MKNSVLSYNKNLKFDEFEKISKELTLLSVAESLKLIKMIMPDILVKGGDYTIENIVGAQEVIESGGKVEILDFHPGYSSTHYINQIKKTLT